MAQFRMHDPSLLPVNPDSSSSSVSPISSVIGLQDIIDALTLRIDDLEARVEALENP